MLSYLGKLFTNVVNTRITTFVETINLIGIEQAGLEKLFNN